MLSSECETVPRFIFQWQKVSNSCVTVHEAKGLPITVLGLAKVAILRTNFHTKHQSSNIGKAVIRSTAPPL